MLKFTFLACLFLLLFACTVHAEGIFDVTSQGDQAAVERLLSTQPELLTHRDPAGSTLLHIAAREGHLELVKLLVAKGAQIDAGDNEKSTSLHIACSSGHLEIVQFLLSKGADLKFQDDNGLSALQWAAYNGQLEVVKYLLWKGADVNIAKPSGSTSLHGAALQGNLELVKLLVGKGAQVEKVNQGGYTPFLTACSGGQFEIARYLLDQGANIKQTNADRFSALHFAVQRGNREFAEFLIKQGIPVQSQETLNWPPLAFALHSGNVEIVELLLKYGADPNRADSSGTIPLLIPVRNGSTPLTKTLLKAGAKANVKDPTTGNSLLHLAAAKGLSDVAAALIKSGAEVNALDASGATPLDYAIRYANADVAKLLRQNKGKRSEKSAAPENGQLLTKALNKGEAALWYLGHCGWAVKTQNHLMVFDYWNRWRGSDNPCLANGHINCAELKDQNVEVFVTHDHTDHYDSTIFTWDDQIKDLTYIFGFQPVPASATPPPANPRANPPRYYTGQDYVYTAPRTQTDLDGMRITTIRSNDGGAGYLVAVDGVTIFHAGDHAAWSVPEGKKEFTDEIDYLADLGTKADIALVNVTGCRHSGHPEELYEGNLYIVNKLNPAVLIPTHGIQNEIMYKEYAQRLAKDAPNLPVFCAENKGDHFIYRPTAPIQTSSR